jgi:hypothetical protein
MSADTITIETLHALEQQTTRTSLDIRKIRIAAERGDISPRQAAIHLRHLGIFLRPTAKP